MDPLDDIGTGDGEEVVVPLEIMTVILEALATEVGLGERMTLDHRTHGPVEQGDASGEEFPQQGIGFVVGKRGLHENQEGLEKRKRPATAR